MVRVATLLFALLFVLEQRCWLAASLAINSAGSGGSASEDPAPGRSPGPPQQPREDACKLQGALKEPHDRHLNVTIVHTLFATDVLITNIVYQIVVRRLSSRSSFFTLQSRVDDSPLGKFQSVVESSCLSSSTFKSQLDGASAAVTVNWSVEDTGVPPEKITNLTFELNYQFPGDAAVYRIIHSTQLTEDCQLHLKPPQASLSTPDFASRAPPDCRVWFPSHGAGHGLVVELVRLNVPCSRGYMHIASLNATQHHHARSHRQAHICGKLEELPENERRLYFPFSQTPPLMQLHGNPVFTLKYYLVDYCYNVTFGGRNGSFQLKAAGELQCTFRIHLPYGNRVALSLHLGDAAATEAPDILSTAANHDPSDCEDGLLAHFFDGPRNWTHCGRAGEAQRQITVVSRENRVVLRVRIRTAPAATVFGLKFAYRAEPIDEIVGVCGFGWISLQQFCVSAVEEARLPWQQAEIECSRRGGHLASVRSARAQGRLDDLLRNSPGYRDLNAYWIGASDKIVEGDFRWSDGLPFSYTNWFPGWSQHGHYNRQPNDDGLSEQDCVELRRIYSLPSSTANLASTFMWNDRDCSTPNYFICERLQNDEPLEDGWPPDCNKSVELSSQQPKAVVSSPGFPRQYPDNADCDTDIAAPPGFRIVLDFEELVVENEPACSYDYLEIFDHNNSSIAPTNASSSRRLCGDWSSKLKLLRYVSTGSKLKLRFSSDYSHHFGGYKARVSMQSALQCSDDRLQLFNNSCYLFVSYPEVTWSTAQQICRGKKAQLASILTPDEERFITTNLRKSTEYRTSAIYWLGAKTDALTGTFRWSDATPMAYMGWLPGQQPAASEPSPRCLSVQWTPSPTPMLPSGLYWKAHRCTAIGGYVCKRRSHAPAAATNFSRTVTGSEGNLTTPLYPDAYYNRLDFSVRIVAPERTRIVLKFQRIDVEAQLECLYDYVEVRSGGLGVDGDAVRFCGSHDTNMSRFNFVSIGNEVALKFHSDYSIAGSGFSLSWRAVDVSACPVQTLTAKEGAIASPNYPDFVLAGLDCEVNVLAPQGKRVWLEFEDYRIHSSTTWNRTGKNSLLHLTLAENSPPFAPFLNDALLTDGSFVSENAKLRIRLQTGARPSGAGFRAHYRIITAAVSEEKIIHLPPNATGSLAHLNHPHRPPPNVDFVQHLIAPVGATISIDVFHVQLMAEHDAAECENGFIEVYDNYYDSNGTAWMLCGMEEEAGDAIVPKIPVSITSFFNSLHIRQKSGAMAGVALAGSLRVQPDAGFKAKVLRHGEDEVEACAPNPCQNGGKCVRKGAKRLCQCIGHFTGLFCALTKCELEPCLFGTCELTNASYKCHCKSGYTGVTCEQKRKPCEGNPCESRGLCVARGDGFHCQCHAWWEGPRCEKRMLHIPYKPLSERMFHEPFWLGLMTVFVVMAVIGLVWCAKRHFPEKIEKLLAEENERNRGPMSSLRSSSVREQLAVASGGNATAVASSPGPAAPRSLFGRLGIRKPSILSLTSPHASHGYVPATARTFSLDDLLKPLPRRSPSPKKKRNNSTPTKKNAAEKKQILQQLISPTNRQLTRKVSLGELMQLTDHQKFKSIDRPHVKETTFGGDISLQTALSDPKLEKKVTFARLLNKVSAEMSSGSEMELGIMQTNRLGCAFARPASTPPSPGLDARSPNSTSSNQGSDSFTSSELALPITSSISDLLAAAGRRPKPASADSILAMFRNFSASSAGVNLPPSVKVSPSSTPTASSPQDDAAGDDESSTSSSVHTPVSFSSNESPVLMHRYHQQGLIEVPVLDMMSKASQGGSSLLHPPTILLEIPSTINKCLSPIREMPTPLPSPAITPLMRRGNCEQQQEANDDRISVELRNISISDDDDDDVDRICVQDIVIDPQAEDGLILEEAAAMHGAASGFRNKPRPPPLGQTSISTFTGPSSPPQPLVIPVLTIQTPSPTHSKLPTILIPGSPPPRVHSHHFQFPPPKQTTSRKMFKDMDKPTSLDLPTAPPMITITCNMSEAESDAESISPAAVLLKTSSHHGGASAAGMSYLSPFSMGHHTSESNLSSSGYSSMASPGPSRCGSSNPLCPSEMEDQGGPGSGHAARRPSPVLKTASSTAGGEQQANEEGQRRGRSDSETLSDDPLLESNDEGIGTDHLDEKIEEGDVKSAKELEVFMVADGDEQLLGTLPKAKVGEEQRLLPPKKTLQLPAIVVQGDKMTLSPVSSRSESPLSDRTSGMGRFSPHFYGKCKDFLPFTDSDGLYDFPSSDKVNVNQHKKVGGGRRKEKRIWRNCKTPSPTKSCGLLVHNYLDVPTKDAHKVPPPRKLSPKRRATRSQVVSSSSSEDSIKSARETRVSSSSPSPDTIRWSSPVDWMDDNGQKDASGGEISDDVNTAMLPKMPEANKHQKLGRLRAISHQIRFLRRLETSLKRRERSISPSDSVDSGGDDGSPRATSPLLQKDATKVEIRKSSSIGKLQTGINSTKTKKGRYKRGELLLPQHDEQSWKSIVITGNGHSD